MELRLVVVGVLVALLAAAPSVYRRRRRRIEAGPVVEPVVPASVLGDTEHTWLVFTTPWCASCGPVEDRLRASDPDAHVVRVDATQEPELAGAFSVRTAPTVLLAARDGRVQARLVGAQAVERYVAARR